MLLTIFIINILTFTEYIDNGYDIPKLNKYLDWFNLLSYDYHSAYEPATNHHAPLYPLEEENEYSFDTDLNIVSCLLNAAKVIQCINAH